MSEVIDHALAEALWAWAMTVLIACLLVLAVMRWSDAGRKDGQ
ncbi:hypothetical protein [Arthrobacter sp. ES3-54]|nr:hypothetical protein [Arthrobacter sp. ES3-54]MDF9748653.1 hypothetical protein [Arthrobacter sp. ES3-54]